MRTLEQKKADCVASCPLCRSNSGSRSRQTQPRRVRVAVRARHYAPTKPTRNKLSYVITRRKNGVAGSFVTISTGVADKQAARDAAALLLPGCAHRAPLLEGEDKGAVRTLRKRARLRRELLLCRSNSG